MKERIVFFIKMSILVIILEAFVYFVKDLI